MKHIELIEEIKILKQLQCKSFLSHGAARMVFECPFSVIQMLNLEKTKDYVIKLAVGLGGFNQNQNELTCFNNAVENGIECLAPIVAYGLYVEIMEAVQIPGEFRDFIDDCCDGGDVFNYCHEYEIDVSAETCDDIYNAFETLNEYFGYTSDNGQLGLLNDGTVVAYDYGFFRDGDCCQTTPATEDMSCNEDCWNTYFEMILENLIEAMEDGQNYLTTEQAANIADQCEDCLYL